MPAHISGPLASALAAADARRRERAAAEAVEVQARSFAKYHEEHARFGGVSREFHERAETFLKSLPDILAAAAAAAGDDEAMAEAADLLDGAQCVGCNPADPDGSYCGRCQRMHRASVALRDAARNLATLRSERDAARSALAECQRERDEARDKLATVDDTICWGVACVHEAACEQHCIEADQRLDEARSATVRTRFLAAGWHRLARAILRDGHAVERRETLAAVRDLRARLTRATERGERMAGAVRALDLRAEETGYGFYHPDNPHDFHPDEESCTPQEIANHKAACDAYDAGARVDPPEVHQHVVSDDGKVVASLLITPWGIGSYALRDEKAAEVLAALAAWDARDAEVKA